MLTVAKKSEESEVVSNSNCCSCVNQSSNREHYQEKSGYQRKWLGFDTEVSFKSKFNFWYSMYLDYCVEAEP